MIAAKALLLLALPLAALADTPGSPCTPTLASPKPTGLHCGDAGAVLNPQTISTSKKPTQEACRDSCLAKTSCISFSYDASTRKCVLNGKTVNSSGYVPLLTATTQFWNRHCYICTCESPRTKCGSGFTARCVNPNYGESCCKGVAIDYTQSCCKGKVTDTYSDPHNCGTCGTQIPAGQTCCGGRPSDLNDIYDCGACFNYVGYGNSCCSGVGANLQTDKNNCGSCGFVCPSGDCEGGKCQILDNPSFEINDGTTPTGWTPIHFQLINNYDQAYNGDYYLNLPGGTADGYASISQTAQNPYPADTPVNWVVYLAVGQDFNAPDGSFTYTVEVDGMTLVGAEDTCNPNENYYCYTVQGGNVPAGGWRVATHSGSVNGFSATPIVTVTIVDQGLTNLNSITDYIRFFITQ